MILTAVDSPSLPLALICGLRKMLDQSDPSAHRKDKLQTDELLTIIELGLLCVTVLYFGSGIFKPK